MYKVHQSHTHEIAQILWKDSQLTFTDMCKLWDEIGNILEKIDHGITAPSHIMEK